MKLIAIAILIYSSSALSYENEPKGFRGYEWGENLESHLDQLKLIEEDKNTKVYKKIGDQLKIGGAELASISYFSGKHGFSGILIKSLGISNRNALLTAFEMQFGPGYKSNKYLDKYLWTGSTTKMYLDCNSITSDCTVLISSVEVLQKEKEDSRTEAAKAGADF